MLPAETLVSASGAAVARLLNRNVRRQARNAGSTAPPALRGEALAAAAAGLVAGLPGARQQAGVGACGTAAVLNADAESDDEPPQQQQQLPVQPAGEEPHPPGALLLGGGQPLSGDEEDWEDAWGDDDDGTEEGGSAWPGSPSPSAAAGGGGSEEGGGGGDATAGLTIVLNRDGSEAGEGGKAKAGGAAKRRGVSRADRDRAAQVHRTHLLCLLARGLAYDAAASDSLLQAQLLSLVPPGPAAKLHTVWGGGGAPASTLAAGGCTPQGLRQQLSWFRSEFKLAPSAGPASASQGPGQGPAADPVVAAALGARGQAGVVEGLRAAVEARRGTPEQLAALFAALLRAQGALVRSVRVLEASSLRPTGAVQGGAGWGLGVEGLPPHVQFCLLLLCAVMPTPDSWPLLSCTDCPSRALQRRPSSSSRPWRPSAGSLAQPPPAMLPARHPQRRQRRRRPAGVWTACLHCAGPWLSRWRQRLRSC